MAAEEGVASQLRRDKATNRWCIIAPQRTGRPIEVKKEREQQLTLEERKKRCPFCPGNEEMTPKPTILQYVKNGGWTLRAVPNKFPAVSLEGAGEGESPRTQKFGVFRLMPGFGAHEVIIDTPDHEQFFADFSPDQANDLFWAFRERISDLRRDKRFQYVLIFRNEGEAAGASLEHSHCQLIALPIVPPLIAREFEEAETYYNDEGSCVYCDMLKQELEMQERGHVFFSNEYAVALTPHASRSPFEVWVLPREHMPRYEESPPSYIRGVSKVVNQAVKRLMRIDTTARLAYNFYLHNGPLHSNESESHFHHHFEIVPRISRLGGFEWGTGLYINQTSPEDAAEFLRNVKLS